MTQDMVFVKKGTETALIKRAEELGYASLGLIYDAREAKSLDKAHLSLLREHTKVALIFGIFQENERTIYKPEFCEVHVALGTRIKTISGTITHIINNEFEDEKDFIHQRRGGLNHVVLASMAEKNIAVLLGFGGLQDMSVIEQARILGRAKQNVKSCKRKKVTYSLVSFAQNQDAMSDSKDVAALRRLLD